MALDIPAGDNPNRMPFSGVLVHLDRLSDGAPSGAQGRRIIVTADAGRRALPSLLGMAVNSNPSLDGHQAKNKIGIITSADIVGNAIRISGFVYAADFPETAALIKAMKNDLGFSFEVNVSRSLTLALPSSRSRIWRSLARPFFEKTRPLLSQPRSRLPRQHKGPRPCRMLLRPPSSPPRRRLSRRFISISITRRASSRR
jgi:hypothetical protein